jgi:hypothetical protein
MPWKNQYLAPVVSNARYAQYTFDVLTLGHAVLNEARDGPLRYRPMLVRYYVISVRQILVECTTRLPPKKHLR